MARVIRRHWRLFLLQLLLVFACIGFCIFPFSKSSSSIVAAQVGNAGTSSGTGGTGAAVAPSVVIDPVTYGRVQQLRQRLALTNEDLAASGCSQAQAAQVISALLNWYNSNAATWSQLEQNRKTAQDQLQEAMREINVGPANSTLLAQFPSLQQAAATAFGQLDQLLLSAYPSISSLFSTAQQSIIATAQTNVALDAPDQYRFMTGLTADKVATIKVLLARSGDNSSAIASIVGSQGVSTASTNLTHNIDGVLAADASVLPIPAQLQLAPPPG